VCRNQEDLVGTWVMTELIMLAEVENYMMGVRNLEELFLELLEGFVVLDTTSFWRVLKEVKGLQMFLLPNNKLNPQVHFSSLHRDMSNDPKIAKQLVPRFLLDGGKETAGETDYCVILVKLPKDGTHQELHHVNSSFFRMCLLCELVTHQNIYDSGPKITTWKKKSQAADAIFVPHARNRKMNSSLDNKSQAADAIFVPHAGNRKMKNSSLDNVCMSILFPAFLIICINLRHVSISCSTAAGYIQRINLKTKGLLKTLIYASEINPSCKKSRCISPSHVTRMEEHVTGSTFM
nr:hypothetical protein [Tanacetum cinerariifolium]